MAKSVLQRAGFEGVLLDQMLGIWWVECYHPPTLAHYYDAVGDIALIDDKWGPSVGCGQVRSLREPLKYPYPDTLRVAAMLRDPNYNATACLAICEGGTKLYKWTPYRLQSRAYLDHIGMDFELIGGHPQAHLWNL